MIVTLNFLCYGVHCYLEGFHLIGHWFDHHFLFKLTRKRNLSYTFQANQLIAEVVFSNLSEFIEIAETVATVWSENIHTRRRRLAENPTSRDSRCRVSLAPVLWANQNYIRCCVTDRADPRRLVEIARATAKSGTWNVPTEVLVEFRVDETPVSELRNWPEMRYMPAATVQRWSDAKESVIAASDFDPEVAALAIEIRRRLILELQRAGAGLLLGSDSPQVFNVPGFAIHRELNALVSAGLTPFEALRTGTVAVDEFLDSNTGVVAVGREADLVLLDANPLVDIRNSRRIHGVMVRGMWHTAASLAERLSPYLGDGG